ncbi:MAG: AMP-binding protein, partial [Acidimicrobiia bacterium]|nr:AMP-binding protein [Acidimicrobiia bacterium]
MTGTEPAQDCGPTDAPLLDETIGANLARTVAEHGDNEALVSRHQGIRWTYREFAARVTDLASGLIGLGLEPGDRVG